MSVNIERGGTPVPLSPMRGALREDDSIESTALQLILTRLESYERQQQALVSEITRSISHTNANVDQLIKAMQQERARSQEAEALLNKRLQELMEARPMDPQTTANMIASEKERIRRELPKRRAAFIAKVKAQPRGTITSEESAIVRLQANGLHFDIKPGVNKNVPQTFLEMWENRVKQKAHLAKLKKDFVIHNGEPRDANHYNALRGHGPLYDPKVGVIV